MAKNKKDQKAERQFVTERNRKQRLHRSELRQARLTARTQSLIGQRVTVRVKDNIKPLVGTVLEVVRKDHEDYPHNARRHVGAYLRVRTSIGDMLSSRHRVKRIKE